MQWMPRPVNLADRERGSLCLGQKLCLSPDLRLI